ncbi:hypothetical protein [Saprospira grandis]|nr:hypothetical protein [Saprospira grandis]
MCRFSVFVFILSWSILGAIEPMNIVKIKSFEKLTAIRRLFAATLC